MYVYIHVPELVCVQCAHKCPQKQQGIGTPETRVIVSCECWYMEQNQVLEWAASKLRAFNYWVSQFLLLLAKLIASRLVGNIGKVINKFEFGTFI